MKQKEIKQEKRIFDRRNYIILLSGSLLILLGYILMIGKGSTLTAYNPDIFSKMRIQIAPIVCLTGYLINIVGIIIIPKNSDKS